MTTKLTLPKIILNRGGLYTIQHTFLNDDTGDAIDITGYTVYFTIKRTPDLEATDASAVVAKTATLTDPTNGLAETTLSTADTTLSPGDYFYDVKYKNSGGTLVSLTGVGDLEVRYSVTNR